MPGNNHLSPILYLVYNHPLVSRIHPEDDKYNRRRKYPGEKVFSSSNNGNLGSVNQQIKSHLSEIFVNSLFQHIHAAGI